MKKCATCGREYKDANLRFCTEDGGSLIEINNETASGNAAAAADELPPTVFSIGGSQNNPPFNPSNAFNSQPSSSSVSPFGAAAAAGNDYANSSSSSPGSSQQNYNYHQSAPPNQPGTGYQGAGGGSSFGNNAPGFNQSYNLPPPAAALSSAPQKSKLPVILGGLALLVVLGGLAIAGIAGFAIYKNRQQANNFNANTSNIYKPPQTPIANTNFSANSNRPPNMNSYPASNANRGATNPPAASKSLESLRQQQMGSFRLDKIEKTDYMKIYPNLEEESLTYINSAGKKVFVNKTRFPSRTEAERVLRDMVQTAKNGGAQFTPVVACYSNDGREVGLTSTRTADKGGAKNYTIYYSQDNIVTFMFNLENDKTAVDEIFKHSEY